MQRTGERVQDGLAAWHGKADGQCAIDYGFHQIIGGVDDDSLKAMDELVADGITSFKLFMAYPGVFYSDDGQILRAMQTAAANGSLIMMHAENGIAIDVLVAQALARGETAPKYHGTTRPWETEEEATHRAIMLAQLAGAPLYVVHMSAKQAVATVAAARDDGWNVFGETCPQYLYLSLEEHLSAPGFEGAKYVCSTPLRARAEGHQDELWKYLRTNDLSVVSTDHCPFCFKEQKELGLGDFSKIPNGIGGVEHRMDLIYQGVVDGQISLPRWVELCATTPARMFGLYPRKGVIAPGSDADVVVYDPNGTTTHQRRHAPHEHGPLGVRRHGRAGPGRHGDVARHGVVRRRRVPGDQGPRALPAPRRMRVPRMSTRRIDHWIGGKRVPSRSGRSGSVYDPATGDGQAEVGLATVEEVDDAVAAAADAFAAWRRSSLSRGPR